MKKLSREYGWSALGVYLSLSALDFPFCFLAVRWLGTDRIAHWEHVVVETFWKGMESVYPEARAKLWPQSDEKQVVEEGAREGGGWGVEEADARNKSESACKWICSLHGWQAAANDKLISTLDATRACICHPQIIHIHPSAAHCGRDAQSGQDAEELGMGESWHHTATLNIYVDTSDRTLERESRNEREDQNGKYDDVCLGRVEAWML